MNTKVSESIFDNGSVIIPMAEVSHIERDQRPDYKGAIRIIFKHSRWVNEHNSWEPMVYILQDDVPEFIKAWCFYRSEIDAITELSKQP